MLLLLSSLLLHVYLMEQVLKLGLFFFALRTPSMCIGIFFLVSAPFEPHPIPKICFETKLISILLKKKIVHTYVGKIRFRRRRIIFPQLGDEIDSSPHIAKLKVSEFTVYLIPIV